MKKRLLATIAILTALAAATPQTQAGEIPVKRNEATDEVNQAVNFTGGAQIGGVNIAVVGGAGISNVVEDVTPQLGGALDANSKQIRISKGADVASTGTLPVLSDGNYFDVTGTTTVTAINSLAAGTTITLQFDGALLLTHHATDLILPTAANVTTAAGDHATFTEYAAGDWRCTSYTRADGTALVGGAVDTVTGGEGIANSGTATNPIIDVDIASLAVQAAPAAGMKLVVDNAGTSQKIDWSDLPGAAGGISDVVDDTTPQLGGTLDANSKQIRQAKGADVASATALPVVSDGNYFDVTGTTTVTSINGLAIGTTITLQFDAVLIIAHHATDLILPTASNITTAIGDHAQFLQYAVGDWRCTSYTRADGTALAGSGGLTDLVLDTTPQLGGTLDANSKQIRLSKGADVASATALPVVSDGNYFDVTGTTTVTSINSLAAGTTITLQFDGALILTHHATDLILPTAANVTTAAGDHAQLTEYATGDWRCTSYTRADGTALAGSGGWSGTYRELWIPAAAMVPDVTLPPAAGTNSSASQAARDYYGYDDAVDESAFINISMPDAWDLGNIKAQFYWTSAATTGDAIWTFRSSFVSNTDDLDTSPGGLTTTIDTTFSTANRLNIATSAAITPFGTPAIDDYLNIKIGRNAASGSDTLVGDARLIGVKIQYLESSTEPVVW